MDKQNVDKFLFVTAKPSPQHMCEILASSARCCRHYGVKLPSDLSQIGVYPKVELTLIVGCYTMEVKGTTMGRFTALMISGIAAIIFTSVLLTKVAHVF